jgi:signal transduction histidine kinase
LRLGFARSSNVRTPANRESAERAFLTNAAHEFQSPLTAITTAIEVLQAGAKDTPERDIFLGHIEEASARLARLARALLVLARAETDAEAPRTELITLQPLLAEVGSRLIPPDGVITEVHCPPDAAVFANRELLDQAVQNVAENAAKYTETGKISLVAGVDDGRAEISVQDTGPGIPADEQERVFERFYRGQGAGASGSGLGLAVVRAAVEALGGEVELDSTVGEGTTVRIRLPRGASLVEP